MNSKHLGDSYDLVKRTLLQWLGGSWAAHPMLTAPMPREDLERLKAILGIEHLVSEDVLQGDTDRQAYFARARSHRGSLFLDPDKGIRLEPCGGRRSTAYVFGDELLSLTECRGPWLTLVYDQALDRRKPVPGELARKLEHFASRGLTCAAYVSHASFVLLGREPQRVQDAVRRLKERGLPEARILDRWR